MARNFIYNKTLIVITLLSSFLLSQTKISTNVFWYKDKFDALPSNIKNVLGPELDQMTEDFISSINLKLDNGYSFLTTTPVTVYYSDSYGRLRGSESGFTHEEFNWDPQDPEAISKRPYADNPGIRVGSLSTTWKEWLDYHGGYLGMSDLNLTKKDYLNHFESVGIYITAITLGKNNTFKAHTTYLAEEKTLKKGYKVRINDDTNNCNGWKAFNKYKDQNLFYYKINKIISPQEEGSIITSWQSGCFRTPSPIVLDYYGIEMSKGTESSYFTYTNAKGEEFTTSVGNYEEILKGDIITGTYTLPDIDFTDIYRVAREKDGKHKKKVKIVLKFDDESLETIETPFFDIGKSVNLKIYSEAMRRMAEDLKRKDSWISGQIKK
tara:strand:+ start:166 stop:1305 length:1140 start_codon:yes stop_codon:yes gene_type:complete